MSRSDHGIPKTRQEPQERDQETGGSDPHRQSLATVGWLRRASVQRWVEQATSVVLIGSGLRPATEARLRVAHSFEGLAERRCAGQPALKAGSLRG